MPLALHSAMGMSTPSLGAILVALILVSILYLRGWRGFRGAWVSALPTWRAASFLFGVSLIWAALGSPVAAYDHDLLTVHMIQHLLLMTFAPALILLGEPLLAFWDRWPRLGKIVLGTVFRQPFVRRFARVISRPALCWIVSAL